MTDKHPTDVLPMPDFDEEAKQFLHYNPNTGDIILFIYGLIRAERIAAYNQGNKDGRASMREEAAKICNAIKPVGGRMWTPEQSATFEALTYAEKEIRSIEL